MQRGYLFLLAHTPSSRFCTGWKTDREERENALSEHEMAANRRLDKVLSVPSDDRLNCICLLKWVSLSKELQSGGQL